MSEDEIAEFGKIEGAVLMRASPLVTQAPAQIASLEKSKATAPPAIQAQIESTIAELKSSHEKQLAMKEEREEFGDPLVDGMLAEQDTWLRLRKRLAQP